MTQFAEQRLYEVVCFGTTKAKAARLKNLIWPRVCAVFFFLGTGCFADSSGASLSTIPVATIQIDHPISGAVMPANMPPPVLFWSTNLTDVITWTAEFALEKRKWHFSNVRPMWQPPEESWREIKARSEGKPVELVISGFGGKNTAELRARGRVQFSISEYSVKWPLFYREVNLPFKDAVKDPSKIRWRFGAIDTGKLPPVVLENLPVCGNCHSFSRNGEFLAMDVDYANDKGSYIITRVAHQMKLATSDIITWGDYKREDGQPTLGLLSQISPNGRYVLSTVKDMSVFMAMPDLAFSQLFFPFKGIVAFYDRMTRQFHALPGADDPNYVQSNPTWSPDGKYVLFARARAIQGRKSPEPGRILLTGEAREEFLREMKEYKYDIYKVPFNDGKGGKPEPLRGASHNGRSNYFPKYSPDGRWIVFCMASNYMLLQPDSELYIVPAEGGEARRLACNLSLMNSWHSWSPDGRWLVFSSKAHSIYTQLYIAHINENGEASKPVWLAHLVDKDRAANIPEFVDLPPDAIGKINEEFLDDHSYVRAGDEFYRAGEYENAAEKYTRALALNPDNATAHKMLGGSLARLNRRSEAIHHLKTALRLAPADAAAWYNLGMAYAEEGDTTNAIASLEAAARCLESQTTAPYMYGESGPALPESIHLSLGRHYESVGRIAEAEAQYRKACQAAPDYADTYNHLGIVLLRTGRTDQAEQCFRKAISLSGSPDARNNLAVLLINSSRLAEAEEQVRAALSLSPGFGKAHNTLGIIRLNQDRVIEAIASFKNAIACEPENWQAHLNLAIVYMEQGEVAKAIPELEVVLRLNPDLPTAKSMLEEARTVLGNTR
ncbi:MAG: tetratricopeptide repeat protein [Verrucomicrobiae bacterium]|nr:tetratricopeptide repeat protein [Verrucomicrobiae bacterium]